MHIACLVTVLTGVFLMYLGYRVSKTITNRNTKILISILLGIPVLIFLILPLLSNAVWVIELRSITGFEMLSALCGAFFGFVTVKAKNDSTIRWSVYNKYIYIVGLMLIISPFITYLAPVNKSSFKNEWNNGVCMQSTGYLCVPASVATVLKCYNISVTENEAALSMHASRVGTRSWDEVRYLRSLGFKVKLSNNLDLPHMQFPILLEVLVNKIPHEIAILGKEGDKYIVADPLEGKLMMAEAQFLDSYKFNYLIMSINKRGF